MTLPIEEALEGKYEILEKIGEGGIGSVYKVRHRLLDEIRVIKVLQPQMAAKADHQERFLHEARMAIRLKHPNIAQLHDFSVAEEGTAYIVMEFIDGIALDAMLKASGPPSLDMSLEVAQQCLRALSYLHSHDLVHRDVAPDNIMLTSSYDGSAQVKLIDLGIAKNLAEESGLTQTGVFLGKVRYCSPEQFSATEDQGQQLDHRSDIYSFGLILYELATGSYPFSGETFAELAGCHLFQPPVPFEQTDPDGKVPDELRAIILKALEKDPEERFETAEDFRASLTPFRGEERSLSDELTQTVEKATAAIPTLKEYTRPGSTQDRINAEFGLGKTTPPRSLTAVDGAGTTVKPEGAGQGLAKSIPWKWVAGAGALGLVGLAAWLGLRQLSGGSGAGAASEAEGPAVVVEQTEAFAPPERVAIDVALLDAEPPPDAAAGETTADRPAPGPASTEEPQVTPIAEPQGAGQDPPAETPPPKKEIQRTTDIYTVGVGVMAPVLTKLAPPAYPDGKRPRSEISVDVAVLVDEFGNVLTARVESGAGFRRRFRDAAVEAAKQSSFRPAVKNGVAGRMWTRVRIVFQPE